MKTLLTIIIIALIAYAIYYFYNKNKTKTLTYRELIEGAMEVPPNPPNVVVPGFLQ